MLNAPTRSILAAIVCAAPAVAQPTGSSAQGLRPLVNVHTRKMPTLKATLNPEEVEAGDLYGGVCPPEVLTYADNNFDGTFIGTIPPGMVETEIAAISITLAPDAFPVLLNTTEMIWSQVHFNPTVTEWSYLVWEGNPNTGTLVAEFSSDGTILPHVQLPIGGAQAVNLQVSVDPGDPEQIIVQNNGSNTFSVGFRIDGHNSPPSSGCVLDGICQMPAVCCPPNTSLNAWPSMDQAGPDSPAQNWLFGRDCPGASFPFCFLGGWNNFSSPLIPAQFVNDWAIRVTYTPLSCPPGAGACCMGGDCSIATEVDCTGMGGVFAGEGVDCPSANCTAGLGACCTDSGCAELVLQADCESSGGTWLGDGAPCDATACNGACCIPASGGCLSLSSADCDLVGGLFQGPGSDCGAIICFPEGACCLPDGSCMDAQSPDDCNALGGVFQGDQTDCAGTSCPEPVGACCLTAGCLVLTEAECTIVVGSWAGPGTDCSDSGSGTPDACEMKTPCPADLDSSGDVGFNDLLAVLSAWGPCAACPEDIDLSGAVDFSDLLTVLSAWGPCP